MKEKKNTNNKNISNKSKKYIYLVIPILIIVNFVLFYPSIEGDFLYDDYSYIVDNSAVQNLNTKNLAEIWSEFTYGNYNPLTITSYAIEYSIFGLNTTGYHVINIVLNIINCLLIIYFVQRLSSSLIIAAVSALLFSVHPLHVESVSWISGTKDLLYTMFFLISMIYYLIHKEKGGKLYIILSFVFFVFSCLSKGVAVILPIVLILIDYYKDLRIDKKTIADKIPFLFVSLIFGMLSIIGQDTIGSIRLQAQYGIIDKIFLSFYTIYFYLEKLLIPMNLTAFYPFPKGKFDLLIYISPIIVTVISILAFLSRKYTVKGIFSTLFFLLSILPVIQILAVGNAMTADRFAYVASIPFVFMAASFIVNSFDKSNMFYKYRNFIIIISVIWAGWLGYSTFHQAKIWSNPFTLYSDIIEKQPQAAFPYNNLGLAFYNKKQDYEKAVKLFKKAIELKPDFSIAYNNLGNVYEAMGRSEDALKSYLSAIKNDNANESAYNNAGLLYYKMNDLINAEKMLTKALKLKGNFIDALNNYGNVLTEKGEFKKAMSVYNKSLSILPDNPNTFINIAGLYFDQHDIEKAKQYLQKAINIDPGNKDAIYFLEIVSTSQINNPESLNNIPDGESYNKGMKLFESGNYQEAIQAFKEDIDVNPNNVNSYMQLGIALAKVNKFSESILEFEKAIKIQPNNPVLYKNVAVVYSKIGNSKMLVETYRKAAKLGDEPARQWLKKNGIDW